MKTKVWAGIFGILIVMVLITGIGIVMAHGDFSEAKKLIDSNISCNELSKGQLDEIGDYYMEQMHPGEAHEMMHKMMGGEDSEFVKQMHINMAKSIYCGENATMQGSMMGYGMMGGGMMNMMGSGGMMNMMGTNMMGGSFGGGSWGLWSIVGMLFWIALLVALILLIIWLYKKVTGQTTNGSSALEILKKRFAKGEITKREFESMKKEIR